MALDIRYRIEKTLPHFFVKLYDWNNVGREQKELLGASKNEPRSMSTGLAKSMYAAFAARQDVLVPQDYENLIIQFDDSVYASSLEAAIRLEAGGGLTILYYLARCLYKMRTDNKTARFLTLEFHGESEDLVHRTKCQVRGFKMWAIACATIGNMNGIRGDWWPETRIFFKNRLNGHDILDLLYCPLGPQGALQEHVKFLRSVPELKFPASEGSWVTVVRGCSFRFDASSGFFFWFLEAILAGPKQLINNVFRNNHPWPNQIYLEAMLHPHWQNETQDLYHFPKNQEPDYGPFSNFVQTFKAKTEPFCHSIFGLEIDFNFAKTWDSESLLYRDMRPVDGHTNIVLGRNQSLEFLEFFPRLTNIALPGISMQFEDPKDPALMMFMSQRPANKIHLRLQQTENHFTDETFTALLKDSNIPLVICEYNRPDYAPCNKVFDAMDYHSVARFKPDLLPLFYEPAPNDAFVDQIHARHEAFLGTLNYNPQPEVYTFTMGQGP